MCTDSRNHVPLVLASQMYALARIDYLPPLHAVCRPPRCAALAPEVARARPRSTRAPHGQISQCRTVAAKHTPHSSSAQRPARAPIKAAPPLLAPSSSARHGAPRGSADVADSHRYVLKDVLERFEHASLLGVAAVDRSIGRDDESDDEAVHTERGGGALSQASGMGSREGGQEGGAWRALVASLQRCKWHASENRPATRLR